MNISTKKTYLKCVLFFNIIQTVMFALFYAMFLAFYETTHLLLFFMYQLSSIQFFVLMILFALLVLYHIYLCFYLKRKIVCNKTFFNKNKPFMFIVAVIQIFLTTFTAPLLFICIFAKDDGQEEIVVCKQKEKKDKVLQKKINAVKKEHKKGFISKELCNKKIAKIIKQHNQEKEQEIN